MKKKNMYLTVAIISTVLAILLAFVIVSSVDAGGRKKTKIRYKCWSGGERVPCPENFKQSPEFKQYLRQRKARLHDTRRHLMDDEQIPTHRTYMDSTERTYYDETIREEAEND
jgi:predicted metal-binding protein